jgi:hypothetical protein
VYAECCPGGGHVYEVGPIPKDAVERDYDGQAMAAPWFSAPRARIIRNVTPFKKLQQLRGMGLSPSS